MSNESNLSEQSFGLSDHQALAAYWAVGRAQIVLAPDSPCSESEQLAKLVDILNELSRNLGCGDLNPQVGGESL